MHCSLITWTSSKQQPKRKIRNPTLIVIGQAIPSALYFKGDWNEPIPISITILGCGSYGDSTRYLIFAMALQPIFGAQSDHIHQMQQNVKIAVFYLILNFRKFAFRIRLKTHLTIERHFNCGAKSCFWWNSVKNSTALKIWSSFNLGNQRIRTQHWPITTRSSGRNPTRNSDNVLSGPLLRKNWLKVCLRRLPLPLVMKICLRISSSDSLQSFSGVCKPRYDRRSIQVAPLKT